MVELNAQLPANYESREMRLCLIRVGNKWSFCYRDERGYSVPLASKTGCLACSWQGFKTRKAAKAYADQQGFPPYAIWSGQLREYSGWHELPPESRAVIHARNKGGVSWKGSEK